MSHVLQVVKIKRAPEEATRTLSPRVMIFARGHAGVQYRDRHSLPMTLRHALQGGVTEIFAEAYLNRKGRWTLPDRAPVEGWSK